MPDGEFDIVLSNSGVADQLFIMPSHGVAACRRKLAITSSNSRGAVCARSSIGPQTGRRSPHLQHIRGQAASMCVFASKGTPAHRVAILYPAIELPNINGVKQSVKPGGK
jgi:hypothetical protein